MKYTIKKMSIIFLLLLLVVVVNAQTDALSAIQKIYAAYNTGSSLHFSGSMKMYLKTNPGKIIERMQSNYVLKGENFSCNIGPVQMLLNDTYYVSVDKTIKMIVIGNKKDLSGIEQIPVLNTGRFKKWINEKSIAAAVTSQGATSVLQLTDARAVSGYSSYRIEYNTFSGYMKKVLLEMADSNDPAQKKVVLEIDYTNPVIAERGVTFFSEKPFFSVVNNKVQVTENYKDYELINQL